MSNATLNSTFLREASYDDSTSTLTVVFNNGRTYSYQNVDRAVFQGLIDADSSSPFSALRFVVVLPPPTPD